METRGAGSPHCLQRVAELRAEAREFSRQSGDRILDAALVGGLAGDASASQKTEHDVWIFPRFIGHAEACDVASCVAKVVINARRPILAPSESRPGGTRTPWSSAATCMTAGIGATTEQARTTNLRVVPDLRSVPQPALVAAAFTLASMSIANGVETRSSRDSSNCSGGISTLLVSMIHNSSSNSSPVVAGLQFVMERKTKVESIYAVVCAHDADTCDRRTSGLTSGVNVAVK